MRLDLRLDPSRPWQGRSAVDAAGCVMVTLLTTSLGEDMRRLIANGGSPARCCGPWPEHVGGRNLEVCILEGPSGALVELLELPRGGNRTGNHA